MYYSIWESGYVTGAVLDLPVAIIERLLYLLRVLIRPSHRARVSGPDFCQRRRRQQRQHLDLFIIVIMFHDEHAAFQDGTGTHHAAIHVPSKLVALVVIVVLSLLGKFSSPFFLFLIKMCLKSQLQLLLFLLSQNASLI